MININDKQFPVSFSQSRQYSECPRKYKLKYADGIKEPSNPNLELGNAVHLLAEKQYWNNQEELLQNIDICNAVSTIIKQRGQRYFEMLVNELKAFFEDKIILYSELELRDADYTAKIDIVYKFKNQSHKIYLADFKVTKKPKTTDSIFSEGQLLFYKERFLANDYADSNNIVIYVQYINILSYISDKIVTITEPLDISEETCQNYRSQIIDKNVELINKSEFPKKKKWCNWCFYKDICNAQN